MPSSSHACFSARGRQISSKKTFLLIAFVTHNVAGCIFIGLASGSVFGAVGSLGFVFSIFGGIVLVSTSIGILIWLNFINENLDASLEQKPSSPIFDPLANEVQEFHEARPFCEEIEDAHNFKNKPFYEEGPYFQEILEIKKLPPLKEELHTAAFEGSVEDVRFYLQKEYDVDGKDIWGQTPLHKAIVGGRLSNVIELSNHGADLSSIDNNGQTILHKAVGCPNAYVPEVPDEEKKEESEKEKEAAHKNLLILKKIIELSDKTLLSMPDNWGNTPLHEAVLVACPEVVLELIQNGAPLESKDKDQKTPLYRAVEAQEFEIVKILTAHKAQITQDILSQKTSEDIRGLLQNILAVSKKERL